jgi:hypothetical protein
MKLYRTVDELAITGSIKELAEVYKSLKGATENYSETFIFETLGSPKPYDFFEKRLQVSISTEPACATFNQDDGVIIKGNVESIQCLASFFDFESDAKTGEHYHWDNCCDSRYTSESTLPIVVSVA